MALPKEGNVSCEENQQLNAHNEDLTFDEQTYTSLVYTLLALLILIFFFSASLFIPTAHDIVLQYGHESKASWVATYVQNGRYIPAAVLFLITACGYDYFNTIGFWILGFSSALWFCTWEFVRYIKLPYFLTPLLTLMIGLHGFWTEFTPPLMGYLEYTSGLIGSGLALWCARVSQPQRLLSVSLVTLCLWVALASYPPIALIPLFGALLALVRDSFLESDQETRRGVKSILSLFLGFAFAYLFYFMTSNFSYLISLKATDAILPVNSFAFLFKSLSFPLFFPLHERIIYGFAHIGMMALVLCIHPWRLKFLILAALTLGFFIGSLAFTETNFSSALDVWPEPPYYPHLINRIPVAFFHGGLVILLGMVVHSIIDHRHYFEWPLRQLGAGALCTLVFLSGGNQLSYLMERWWHYEHDYAIASGIVADLRDMDLLRERQKIFFVYENPILVHAPISAFLSHNENALPFLKRVSGFTFTTVPQKDRADIHYETLCNSRHTPWDIHYKNDVVFICLSSLDRKALHDTARGKSS